MANCEMWEVEQRPDGKKIHECRRCRRRTKPTILGAEFVRFDCLAPPAAPGLLGKLSRFALAWISHVTAGSPTCSQAQIDARLNICRGCEFFQIDTCQRCGCRVTSESRFLNKLGWADQECPEGKWPREN